MILEGLNATLYVAVETMGEHGRGNVIAAELVAKVSDWRNNHLGNWVVMRYVGPDAEAAANRKKADMEDMS